VLTVRTKSLDQHNFTAASSPIHSLIDRSIPIDPSPYDDDYEVEEKRYMETTTLPDLSK
jgi:hypothetical protein